MDTPNPDPGEEYTHVNTQLFGVIDPPGNRGVMSEQMVAPYNAPAPGQQPTMDGFVAVPSQTLTNRSFFHAGSASGFVVNSFPTDAFPVHNTAETLLQRLEANGPTWRLYCDNASVVPFTGMIHASQLRDRFANFHTLDQFLEDAETGRLPTYSFIEPNLLHGHNDMHPSSNAMFPGLAFDAPSSLLGGEAFLAQIYDAVRSSSSPDGSNAYNTLLMVNFDEHGGTYDHIPRHPRRHQTPAHLAVRWTSRSIAPESGSPPSPSRPGSRNAAWSTTSSATPPCFAPCVSASLGAPFSAREAIASTLGPVASLGTPRAPEA